MKSFFLILIISLFVLPSIYAQNENNELLNKRDQYYQQYKGFKDTMTIRTWINMVELSKRLEAVVEIDNVLLDSLLIGTPNNANLEVRVRELLGVRDQLIMENARLNTTNDSFNRQKKNYIFIIILISIAIIGVTFFCVMYLMKFRNVEKFSGKSSEKILSLKQVHKKELDILKTKIEKLKENQILMENNAIQMKKSFDVLKSGNVLQNQDEGEKGDGDLTEVRKEMQELSSEINSILEEKKVLEEDLRNANNELKKYQKANKLIEGELEGLLKKLKKEE